MYPPKIFQETDVVKLQQFIVDVGFCTLVSSTNGAPDASHLPILLDETRGRYGLLRGHFSASNPHAANLTDGDMVKMIFMGPHAYVSPAYYPSKKREPRVAPTTNYVAVEAVGGVRIYQDASHLEALLRDMTEHFEGRSGNSWSVTDLPEGFLAKVVRAIIGFEVEILELVGKSKLSQERPAEDYAGVIKALSANGGHAERAIALEMETRTIDD